MKKPPMRHSFALGIALISSLLAANPGRAQQSNDPSDPPERVARISYLQGKVSLNAASAADGSDQTSASEDNWQDAGVNRPLTSGDRLWVDAQSRAELQVGTATLHVDQNTAVSLLSLDDQALQLRLTGGALNLRVRELGEHETVEVDTPNVAVSVIQPGEYHIEVNDSGDATLVSVRSGELTVSRDTQNFAVRAGEQSDFSGNDPLMARTSNTGAQTSFEKWSHDRDTQEETARSREYVAPEVIGAGDLDANGSWSTEPDYGAVWYPSHIEADWAPYRYGHWTWVAPWGWTWVDQAPWGFAPFHYGRWAYLRSRWCWVPGPRHERAVYAPALVAWVGGPRVSVSVNVGGGPGVGWFPLAPREVYVPAYRVSPRYLQHVNVTNTVIVNKTSITNVYENRVTNIHYANRTAPRGLTVVRQDTFTSSRPVARNLVHANDHDLQPWQARTALANIRPNRAAFIAQNATRAAQVRRPPQQLYQRPIVARHEPRGSAEFNQARRVAAPASAPNNIVQRPESGRPPSPGQAHNGATNLRMQRIPYENRDAHAPSASAGANSTAAPPTDRPDWAQRRHDHMIRNGDNSAAPTATRNMAPEPAPRSAPIVTPPPAVQNAPQRWSGSNEAVRRQQENDSRMQQQRAQEMAARAAHERQQAEQRPVMTAPAASVRPPAQARPEPPRPEANRNEQRVENRARVEHQAVPQSAPAAPRAPAPPPHVEAPHNNPPPHPEHRNQDR